MKFCGNVGDPSHFLTPLPDCLRHVWFSTYSPLSVEIVEKPNKCKSFLAPFFSGGTTPTFLRHIVSVACRPPFDKVRLRSVCWSLSAKPGNKVECGIYGGWVKTTIHFEAVDRPKFMSFWDNVADPLWVATHLSAYVYLILFRRYKPLKLPLSCEIAKKVVLGPDLYVEGIPQISDMHFQITLPTMWPDVV